MGRGSSSLAARREILDSVCLNRTLSDVNLVLEKRKHFDVFAKGLDLNKSRGDWHSFEPLLAAVVDAALSRSDEANAVIRLLRLSA